MSMIGCVEPRDLSDGEKQLYSETMQNAQPVIREATERILGPRASVSDFRRAFHAGNLKEIRQEEATAVYSVQEIEYPVLQGYCRLVPGIAKPFYRQERRHKIAVEFDDYIQEGMCAIADSMYAYNGSTEFSTYTSRAVRNRLIDYARRNNSLSPVKKRILKLQTEVKRFMIKGNMSFDEAVKAMDVTDSDLDELKCSMSSVITGPEENDGWDEFLSAYSHAGFDGEAVLNAEQVRQALTDAPLSDLERDVLESVLNGGTKSEVTELYNVSRSAGSQAYDRAINKIREKFHQLQRAA